MNINQTDLRHVVQGVLEKHNVQVGVVELEMELTGAVWRFLNGDGSRPVNAQTTQDAFLRGLTLDEELRSTWYSRFHTNPNWDTKTNQEFLHWLKERPKVETLDKFASWWYSPDNWRGEGGSPPTVAQVKEFWPQAFLAPTEKPGAVQRTMPLPEGI